MILSSFFAALGQLGDPRFRRVLLLGVVLSIVLLIGITAGFVWLLNGLVGEQVFLPIIGEVEWLNDLVSWGSAFLMAFLSIFLMVPVASAITSMFLDEVAQAVEDVHYPHLPVTTPVPMADAIRDTVNFLGVMIFANVLALFLYVIFSPVAPLIFWCLNGFLLGREYFMLAAMRRIGRRQAKILRSQNMWQIWVAGVLMAIPLSIPVVNLLIPVLGAATFTHLFHRLHSQGPSG
ncbi:MAG: EI24 domain-containing protein [Sulfitobacter sp.]